MKTKVLLCILAICLALSCVACSREHAESDTTTASGQDTAAPNVQQDPNSMHLIVDGKACFDVICTEDLPEDTTRGSAITGFYNSLCTLVAQVPGSADAPRLIADTDYEPDADRVAIVIGETILAESAQALSEAAPDAYGYRVINGKIVVFGHTAEEIQMAGDELNMMLKRSVTLNGNNRLELQIANTIENTDVGDLAIAQLPRLTAGSSQLFCDAGDDARLIVAADCQVSDYDDYLTLLQQNGFSLYTENRIGDNRYATLTLDDITADVWFTGYSGDLRVVAQQGFALLPLEKQPAYTKVCEPVMSILGCTEEASGMCLLFRLEDGRFVIIDGGYGTDAWKKLLAEMQHLAPDPEEIVIASWIFTHSHIDHISAFRQLAENDMAEDAAKLTIESFMFNFGGSEQASVKTQKLDASDALMRNAVRRYFPDSAIYKPHPGNEATFANMRVEILGTHESYLFESYPEPYNACCMFLKLTVNDQIICIEADSDATNNLVLEKTYGDYLKCDILQADHHGGFGGIDSLNQIFAPEIVLYFTTDSKIDECLKTTYNQILINNSNFKEYLVVDKYVIRMPLPYVSGTAERVDWLA